MAHYTPLRELEQQKALVQRLRQGPTDGYARNPLGALASGLNAWNANKRARDLRETNKTNTEIEQQELNSFLSSISPESVRAKALRKKRVAELNPIHRPIETRQNIPKGQ